MWLSDRFPGLMLWHTVAVLAAVFAAKALLYWAADWLALGAAQAHHGYLFANARATRVKLIVHDGWGVWCAARRLNAGHFVWPRGLESSTPLALTQEQFDALIVGLPWQRLHERRVITRV